MYLLTLLIDRRFVNFKANSQKTKRAYFLTTNGIFEKSLISRKFLTRKKKAHELIKKEIIVLERDADVNKIS
jgi:hypothetical protein